MVVVSGEVRRHAGIGSVVTASLRIFVLRTGPVVIALVAEPWAALGVAFDLFRGIPELPGGEPKATDIHRQAHIVNAALLLLGLCVTIIGALQLTGQSDNTWSDELAWVASAFMLGSIGLSVSGTRGGMDRPMQMRIADALFLGGIAALLLSLGVAVCQL